MLTFYAIRTEYAIKKYLIFFLLTITYGPTTLTLIAIPIFQLQRTTVSAFVDSNSFAKAIHIFYRCIEKSLIFSIIKEIICLAFANNPHFSFLSQVK